MTGPHGLDDPQQPVGIVDEAALAGRGRHTAEPARIVEHRQQRDRDPDPPRGADDTLGHLRQIAIGGAVAVVVEIVELAHRGVAGLEHLDGELGGDRLDVVRGQAADEVVHHLAPGPEAVLTQPGAFGEPGHRALEGVAVQVGHAGNCDAGQDSGPLPGRNSGDRAMVIDRDPTRREPALAAQHRLEAMLGGHFAQSSMAASISRSTGWTKPARSGR